MSKAVRNIWDPQKQMWDHINSYVHVSNGTIHQTEEEATTTATRWEFVLCKNGLPAAYSGLFTGQLQHILKDERITKSQWLRFVYNSRYWVRITEGLGCLEHNQMSASFIQRRKGGGNENWRNGVICYLRQSTKYNRRHVQTC